MQIPKLTGAIILLGLISTLLSCNKENRQNKSTEIHGIIHDGHLNRPVPHARIAIIESEWDDWRRGFKQQIAHTTADDEGRYSIKFNKSRAKMYYRISVGAPGGRCGRFTEALAVNFRNENYREYTLECNQPVIRYSFKFHDEREAYHLKVTQNGNELTNWSSFRSDTVPEGAEWKHFLEEVEAAPFFNVDAEIQFRDTLGQVHLLTNQTYCDPWKSQVVHVDTL